MAKTRRNQTLRRRVLEKRPNCQRCAVRPSSEVHHITAVVNGGSDDDDNLLALCSECHREIEQYGFASVEEFMKTPPYAFVIVAVRNRLPVNAAVEAMEDARKAVFQERKDNINAEN